MRTGRAAIGALVDRAARWLSPKAQLGFRAKEALATLPPVEQPSLILYTPLVHNNPYQAMLYGGCAERGIAALPVTFSEAVSQRSTLPDDVDIWVHVHWTNAVLARAHNEIEARRFARRFQLGLDRLRSSGIRIIWTVHNALPHEARFIEYEVAVCDALADRATVIHVMHEKTPAIVELAYTLPEDKVRVVPHSSYIGLYPNDISKATAREWLGIPSDGLTLASVGAIRPYKRLDSLVDAFASFAATDQSARLILAGPPLDRGTMRDLQLRCAHVSGIVSRFERLPDKELQTYLNAADVVVLPYDDILNSGALMLAFSFGKPVLASRRGLFTELVTEDVGRLFDPDQPQGLEGGLTEARALTEPRFAAAALTRAQAYLPEAMARDFAELIVSARD
jgi:glycosyltransferase involved in cell wall biosynthesis